MSFLQPVFYAVVSFPLGHFSMHFDAFQQQIGELPPALPARSLRKVPFLVLIMHATGDFKHPTCPVQPVQISLKPAFDLICRFVRVGLCIWWLDIIEVLFSFTLDGLLLLLAVR